MHAVCEAFRVLDVARLKGLQFARHERLCAMASILSIGLQGALRPADVVVRDEPQHDPDGSGSERYENECFDHSGLTSTSKWVTTNKLVGSLKAPRAHG